MRYFWLLDKEAQRIFNFLHHPRKENLGNFYTKSFDGKHHQQMGPLYQHEKSSPQFMSRAQKPSTTRRGCVKNMQETTVSKPRVVPIPTYNICRNLEVGPQLLHAD